MVKILSIKISTLERWKRLIARREFKLVWTEIESFRSSGGDTIDSERSEEVSP